MKRTRFAALALCVVTLALGACGDKTPAVTTETPTTTEPIQEEVNMTEIDNGLAPAGAFYTNKLVDSAADPFILCTNNMYYLYSTGGTTLSVRSSKALTSWSSKKQIFAVSMTDWAENKLWAPEVFEHNGKYYLAYCATKKGSYHCIDIAVCDTPDGTFVPFDRKKPLFDPGFAVIDVSLFFDDDGRIYMFYSRDNSMNYVNGKRTSQTWGVELSADMKSLIGTPVLISTPEQSWELQSGSVVWNEGPVVFKENGRYYLLYSANYYTTEKYAVGYAYADTPLCRYTKEKNCRILAGNGKTVTGPGHCNYFRSPDGSEIWICYHVHTVPPTTDGGRSLAIDRLIINEDGTLSIDGPSEVRRPLPSGINGYTHITDGFTATAQKEKSEYPSKQGVAYVFDGIVSRNFANILSLEAEGGSLDITFDTPHTTGLSLLVYPSMDEISQPQSLEVVVNGTYVIKGLKYRSESGAPITVALSNLPEGTEVKTISILPTAKDGLSYAGISEVMMIEK